MFRFWLLQEDFLTTFPKPRSRSLPPNLIQTHSPFLAVLKSKILCKQTFPKFAAVWPENLTCADLKPFFFSS